MQASSHFCSANPHKQRPQPTLKPHEVLLQVAGLVVFAPNNMPERAPCPACLQPLVHICWVPAHDSGQYLDQTATMLTQAKLSMAG